MEDSNLVKYFRQHKTLDIEFENVWLTVKENKGYKKIIKGVSGQFKSGELTAIMGPSGAGKTSLLNILTGYQITGVEGAIKCTNGKTTKKGAQQYKKDSCYILQDDYLLPYFSIYEIMYSTTKLKVDKLSKEETDYLIDDILTTIGLLKDKKTLCGNLSGGQRKRLSIALELIDDPTIMFLDEPTTGLDSSSSKQCVQMLKSLAERGRTIVCTIHQPSAPIYMTFNHIYIMAQGKCAYQGTPSNTIPFLARLGYICPQYHNPADFMLDVTNGDYGDCVDKLEVAAKEKYWRNSVRVEKDIITEIEPDPILSSPPPYEIEEKPYRRKIPSEWVKFTVLVSKQLDYIYRDWSVAKLKCLLHFLVGIFLGVTFQNVGYDASRMVTNMAFFMVSIVYLSYTSLMPAVLKFPLEFSILKKEHFNRWYALRTYYAAFLVADIPLQIILTSAYTIGSYIISAQPLEWGRFGMVLLVLSTVSLISSGVGLTFGTLLNPINGTFVAAVMTAVSITVSGFICLYPDMNKVMYFFSNFSFMGFCMEGLLQAIYGFNRGKLICPETEEFCLYTNPKEILRDVGMDNLPYWADVGWMFVHFFIFRILAYSSLKFKLRTA